MTDTKLRDKRIVITLLIVMLTFVAMIGIWTMDLGAGLEIINCKTDATAITTNGWWTYTPTQTYHMGMYTIFFAILMLSAITIYAVNSYWSDL